MRSIKSCGGLTHGRGITDSTLTKWILGMPVLSSVSDQIEEYCNTSFVTSEQHVDGRSSRVARDNLDIQKFVDWFSDHSPFLVNENIMSLSTGLVGDDKIICYCEYDIGLSMITSIIGGNFGNVKFQRKQKVLPIASIN